MGVDNKGRNPPGLLHLPAYLGKNKAVMFCSEEERPVGLGKGNKKGCNFHFSGMGTRVPHAQQLSPASLPLTSWDKSSGLFDVKSRTHLTLSFLKGSSVVE